MGSSGSRVNFLTTYIEEGLVGKLLPHHLVYRRVSRGEVSKKESIDEIPNVCLRTVTSRLEQGKRQKEKHNPFRTERLNAETPLSLAGRGLSVLAPAGSLPRCTHPPIRPLRNQCAPPQPEKSGVCVRRPRWFYKQTTLCRKEIASASPTLPYLQCIRGTYQTLKVHATRPCSTPDYCSAQ